MHVRKRQQNHKGYLFLCKSNGLFNGHGEFSQHCPVVRIFWQVYAIEAGVGHGQTFNIPINNFDSESTGTIRSLEPLEPVDWDARSTGDELDKFGTLLTVKPSSTHYKHNKIVSYLPE